MSIKDHAMLVSLSVNKPQMTQKDSKATSDAELANNAHGAGQYRKDLYPKALVQPILTVESAARAYIESTTYMWNRGDYLLPASRFMEFAERMSKFEVEFNQSVTAFLNNWSNVMMRAQESQGALFNADAYPDLTEMRQDFRFRVLYRPVTDANDFRVQIQQEELDSLKAQVESATKESMNAMLRSPLARLKEVVAKLHEVTGRTDRAVLNKRTGVETIKPPIFRDSVCENIAEEIALLRDFAEMLPDNVMDLANSIVNVLPKPQELRDNPDRRMQVNVQSAALLDSINALLED